MKNNIMIVLAVVALFLSGCGQTTKTITETNSVYVNDYAHVRAQYAFENMTAEPVSDNATLLLQNFNGPIGLQSGGASIVSPGCFGNALSFTATNQRYVCPVASVSSNYDDLEISLWFNPAGIATTYKTLIAKWQTTGELEYRLCSYSNVLVFYTSYNGTNVQTYTSYTTKPIIVNKWNHVSVRMVDNYLTFYVNGASAGRFYVSSGIRKGNSDVQIGQRVTDGTPAEQYLGLIDAVKISNKVQSETTAIAVVDASGNGNNGSNYTTGFGSNTLDGTKSLLCNGTSDFVAIGSHDSLSINGPFTISVDVKPDGAAASQYVVCKGAGGYTTKYNYYIRLSNNKPAVGFQDVDGSLYELVATTTLANGVWARVKAVWDGEYLKIYVDGVAVGSLKVRQTDAAIALATNDCPLMFGRLDYQAYYYKGEIDNVKIVDQVN